MRLRPQSELSEETQPGKSGMSFGSGETQSNESRIDQASSPHREKLLS